MSSLREIYVATRSAVESARRRTKFTYRPPRHYDGTPAVEIEDGGVLVKAKAPVWPALETRFRKEGIDPAAYVPFQLSSVFVSEPIPEPNQLLTPERLARWREQANKAGPLLRAELVAQDAAFERETVYRTSVMGKGAAAARVSCLGDPKLPLSALYRYCAAAKLAKVDPRFTAVVDRFHGLASLQLATNVAAYKDAWHGFLPADFEEVDDV